MKMRLRFIVFFVGGLFAFIIVMGLFVAFSSEYLIPTFFSFIDFPGLLELFSIMISFIVGGILLGLFFVNPLLLMISLIRRLSAGEYDLSEKDRVIYRKSGKLKARYYLYKELVNDINLLAQNLVDAEKQRAQVEQDKTNWIAGISHDLKTPLSYITGYSSLLLNNEQSWSKDEEIKFLTEIHGKSQYIAEMIGDLNLSFKIESMKEHLPLDLVSINLIDFIQRLIADIANDPRASSAILELDTEISEIKTMADTNLLQRAIRNIVMNAILHNPIGTKVEISIKTNKSLEQAILVIKDNGEGIHKELLDNIFLRYYKPVDANNKVESSGLGLSLAKSITEAHKGEIAIESVMNMGTVVTITLPTFA